MNGTPSRRHATKLLAVGLTLALAWTVFVSPAKAAW